MSQGRVENISRKSTCINALMDNGMSRDETVEEKKIVQKYSEAILEFC